MKTQGGGAATAVSTRSGAFNRRQFLAGAAGLTAGTYLLGPNTARDFEEGRLGELLRHSTRFISIGFIAAGHGLGHGRDALAEGVRVVSATALRSGSRTLHGKTVFGLHGLTAGLGDPVAAGIHAVHLDAVFPAPRGVADVTTLPFHAWSMRAKDHAQSSNSSFGVDVDSKPRLGFSLEVHQATGANGADAAGVADSPATAVDPARAVFTTGHQAGMAKLRPGTYLLGLSPGVWDRPRYLPDPADEAAWAAAKLASLVVTVSRAA
jgi:hypothetical protein